MSDFGERLRAHRQGEGLSQRQLGELVRFHFTHISQVERGVKRPSADFVGRCDRVLNAGGTLVEAYEREVGESDMRRRSLLRAAGAVAVAPVVGPFVGLEAVRHSLDSTVDVAHDEWDQIITDYGYGYYRVTSEALQEQLDRDIKLVQLQLIATSGAARVALLRTAAKLSVLAALVLVASGQSLLARRFWRTARRAADQSGDADARLLVEAWDTVNGCYDGRPVAQVVALSDEVLPLVGRRASSASCGLLAGRAQALSLANRHEEAITAVRQLRELTEQLPDSVSADTESLWGWPEHRLRHTESWVFTHAGRLAEAEIAQERALTLYPSSQQRLRAQVQLHRATCLIRGGDIPDGLRLAADMLDTLPPESHNELLRTVARQVIEAVPTSERQRVAYAELTDRVNA